MHPRRGPGRPSQESEDGPGVREALLQAAGDLFARRGYAAVSLRAVAREAGATPAMVHYYFGDKSGLYQALLDHTLGHLFERIRRTAEETPPEADVVGRLLAVMVGTLGEEPWIPQLILREVLLEEGSFRDRFVARYAGPVAALLPRLIGREIEAGRMREDLDPYLAFASLIGMTMFPFVARPVLERVLGFAYDEDFRQRLAEHNRRLFRDGTSARHPEVSS